MNMDVQDLVKRIKIRDPFSAGVIVALAVALILFAVVLSSLLRITAQRRDLQSDLETTLDAIEQIKSIQSSNPDNMQQRISQAQAELQKMLVGVPTKEQAAAELARYYEYAAKYHTQLVRTEAMMLRPEEQAETAYQVQRFLIEARGNVPDLMRFLAQVSSGSYSTFVLDSISIRSSNPAVASADLAVFSSDLAASMAITPTIGITPTMGVTPTVDAGGAAPTAAAPPTLAVTPTFPPTPAQKSQSMITPAPLSARATPTSARAITPSLTPTLRLTIHTVRSGETLSGLAWRYHTTTKAIREANNMTGSTIYVGQKLVIPPSP